MSGYGGPGSGKRRSGLSSAAREVLRIRRLALAVDPNPASAAAWATALQDASISAAERTTLKTYRTDLAIGDRNAFWEGVGDLP